MEKEFITYEQALALKELGFDEPCFGYYLKGKNELNIGFIKENRIYNETSNGNCLIGYGKSLIYTPSYSQAFRWFRKEHKLCGVPQYFTGGFYCYSINDMEDKKESNRLFTEFETYEEAEQSCLDKLIEIVKIK